MSTAETDFHPEHEPCLLCYWQLLHGHHRWMARCSRGSVPADRPSSPNHGQSHSLLLWEGFYVLLFMSGLLPYGYSRISKFQRVLTLLVHCMCFGVLLSPKVELGFLGQVWSFHFYVGLWLFGDRVKCFQRDPCCHSLLWIKFLFITSLKQLFSAL